MESYILPLEVKLSNDDVLHVLERQPLVCIAQLAPAQFSFWGIGVSGFRFSGIWDFIFEFQFLVFSLRLMI